MFLRRRCVPGPGVPVELEATSHQGPANQLPSQLPDPGTAGIGAANRFTVR
jgi:hypothetical protein